MATISISALPSGYTLAVTGAALIDLMEQGTVRVVIATSLPSPAFGAFFVFGYNEGGFSYSGTEKVYIMSNDGATHLCVAAAVI